MVRFTYWFLEVKFYQNMDFAETIFSALPGNQQKGPPNGSP